MMNTSDKNNLIFVANWKRISLICEATSNYEHIDWTNIPDSNMSERCTNISSQESQCISSLSFLATADINGSEVACGVPADESSLVTVKRFVRLVISEGTIHFNVSKTCESILHAKKY